MLYFCGIGLRTHCILRMALAEVHTKCRAEFYPFNQVRRLQFPDDCVSWHVEFSDYNPAEYNSEILENKVWADPPIGDSNFNPKWNCLDNKVNRQSFEGTYQILDGRPLNPRGRTGLKGRGVLGKWGPNHAADPIVTRWKLKDGENVLNSETNLPILEFCAIQRKDCKEWALPGGMVDPGEKVSETLKREFLEEALNSLESSEDQREKDRAMITDFFKTGIEIYRGYVDDPRNTDNAWMETVAVNFHDADNSHVAKFNLTAGDDAQNVQWIAISKQLKLYASHSKFIQIVAEKLGASW